MLLPIAHRGVWSSLQSQNTIDAIQKAKKLGVGVETDLRSFMGQLYLSHDAIKNQESLVLFETLLKLDFKKPVFINVKEDGLLSSLTPYFSEIKNNSFIFFDMSSPQLFSYSKILPPKNLAARISDIEPHPILDSKTEWLWVDCFEKDFNADELLNLEKKYPNHTFVFVSPELHKRDPKKFWSTLKETNQYFKKDNYLCTDHMTYFLEVF